MQEVQSHRAVRVVTYDQRGHGRSTWGSVRAQSIKGLADDLATVIEATAPTGPLVIGGHSMGGMTLLAYAGRHADAVRERVRGVALLSTTATVEGRREIRGEALAMAIASRVPLLRMGMFVPRSVLRNLNFGENPDRGHVRSTVRTIAGTSLATTGRYFASIRDHDESEALAEARRRPDPRARRHQGPAHAGALGTQPARRHTGFTAHRAPRQGAHAHPRGHRHRRRRPHRGSSTRGDPLAVAVGVEQDVGGADRAVGAGPPASLRRVEDDDRARADDGRRPVRAEPDRGVLADAHGRRATVALADVEEPCPSGSRR